MSIELYDYQLEAVKKMHNGCILCGGVGSGKSKTSLSYYHLKNGGKEKALQSEKYIPMKNPKDLYIITTARKRDSLEWEDELSYFLLSTKDDDNYYDNKVVVDSWNNIAKYVEIKNAFFIFDEQRVVGYGKWTKSFLKIAKDNEWILLSATPGDTWMDYMPVFIANGYYKNKTDFIRQHVVYSSHSSFPRVERYLATDKLYRIRNDILVPMRFAGRKIIKHHEEIFVEFDRDKYKTIIKKRWNIWRDEPIQNASGFCQALRRSVNEDISRQIAVLDILENHPKVIIFYNYNYELDILEKLFKDTKIKVARWNGFKHEPIPKESESWVYLVQYNSGAEGWNCIDTDTIIFFSQNYSYRTMIQAAGRIDRLNTPYKDLYYYHLKSRSSIDIAIGRALKNKERFNERKFYNG